MEIIHLNKHMPVFCPAKKCANFICKTLPGICPRHHVNAKLT